MSNVGFYCDGGCCWSCCLINHAKCTYYSKSSRDRNNRKDYNVIQWCAYSMEPPAKIFTISRTASCIFTLKRNPILQVYLKNNNNKKLSRTKKTISCWKTLCFMHPTPLTRPNYEKWLWIWATSQHESFLFSLYGWYFSPLALGYRYFLQIYTSLNDVTCV